MFLPCPPKSNIFSYLTEQHSWHKRVLLQLETTGAEVHDATGHCPVVCGGIWLHALRCPEPLEMPLGNLPGLRLLAHMGAGVPEDPAADQPAPLDVLHTSGHLKWPRIESQNHRII